MTKFIRKTLSVFLAVLIVFGTALIGWNSGTPSFEIAANAENGNAVDIYRRVYDSTSEYGLASYHWEDADGNTVELSSNSALMYCSRSAFPSYYSSVDEGYVTPVENQLSTSLCWAYSALSTIGSYGLKHGIAADFGQADFSEAHLGWFSGTASKDINDPLFGEVNSDVSSGGAYETGGDWKQAGVFLAAGKGLAYQDSYSNAATRPVISEEYRYDRSAGILTGMEKICETANISTVKSSIINYGAVKASYYNTITNKFINNNEYNSDTYAYYKAVNDGVPTNHAVSIVGWDDAFPKENFINQPDGDGAWLVKNSWGTLFGDDGYFWISYYDATLSSFIRFSYTSANTYDNFYQYDGDDSDIIISKDGYSSVETANVFTAKGNETLKAVGFFTLQDSVSATVKIYKNLPDGFTSPTEGTLAQTVYSSASYEGYHTVELNEPVKLDTDEKFAVVITLNAFGTVYIPANTGNGYYSGNSYVNFSIDAPDWNTAEHYTKTADSNLCIKAFTSDIAEPDGENARTYTVNYYTEDLNGNFVLRSETHKGCAGDTARVSTQVERGLEVNKERSTLSGIIADDNSLVLDVYINRLSFSITFLCEDNSETYTLKYGESVDAPEFAKEGYTVEWQSEVPKTMPGTDIVINGKFVAEKYFIYWKVNNKTLYTHEYTFGEKITIPSNPTNFYGSFLGWDIEIPKTMPAKDLIINAVFEWKEYSVIWNWNGGTRTDTVEYGAQLTPPDVPDLENGYVFYNWDSPVPETMLGKDLTFNAEYGPKLYNADFYVDGVKVATKQFSAESDKSEFLTDSIAPARNGYKVVWDDFEFEANDISISGKYVPVEYSISFVANGETLHTQYFTVETIDTVEITEPKAPPKAGFVNSRWAYYELSLEDITVIPRYDSPTVTTSGRQTVTVGKKVGIIASCNFERTGKSYSSSNVSVVTVDNNGNVNAVGIGECYVTVTCYGYDELGNEISAKSTVQIIVKEKFEPQSFEELFREAFERFFQITLHDFAYNLRNFMLALLKAIR